MMSRLKHLSSMRGEADAIDAFDAEFRAGRRRPQTVRPPKRKKTNDPKAAPGEEGEQVQKFEWRQALKMPAGWMQKVYQCPTQPSGIRTACFMAPDGKRYNSKNAAISAMALEAN